MDDGNDSSLFLGCAPADGGGGRGPGLFPPGLGLHPLSGGAGPRAREDAPDLGADMAEIRARVFGRRAPGPAPATTGALSPDEERRVYDELKGRHQIDLNDENNLADLEDPSLLAHMEAARRRLAEQQKALARLPRREELRTGYVKTMGTLSRLLQDFEELEMAGNENVENAHRHPRMVSEFLARKTPHGCAQTLSPAACAEPSVGPALSHLREKGEEIARGYADVLARVGALKGALFVARREVETVGDGLLKLLEAAEEDRRLYREYLFLGPRAEAARRAGGPPDSFGERLLAAPALPEDGTLRPIPENDRDMAKLGVGHDGE